ncbi:energy transducer TonB [Actomonas aquatica]|uniref:Energy transducer TonB n=1 Tax=Actomonas aquatica TaxID=2866162 RepID=A0ABZ1C3W4_9BACT|nr:energy transducer TonB [Opitutus sp. WL0086]WRQ86196.1 energy transducer TonB [Opitutus sp. WL0086]
MPKHTNRLRLLSLIFAFVGSAMCAVAGDPVVHSQVDENPQPLRTPPPVFPAELKAQGVTGMVLVEVVIDDQGKVSTAEVVKSTVDGFNAASVKAVSQWVFKPAKKDGAAVWVRLRLPLKFS